MVGWHIADNTKGVASQTTSLTSLVKYRINMVGGPMDSFKENSFIGMTVCSKKFRG